VVEVDGAEGPIAAIAVARPPEAGLHYELRDEPGAVVSADFRDEEFDPSRGPRSEIAGYLQPGVDFGNWWRIAEIMRSKAGL